MNTRDLNFKVTFETTVMEKAKEWVDILNEMSSDERIDIDVRKEYANRVLDTIEKQNIK